MEHAAVVRHPEHDDTGTVVEATTPAWTPNELTATAPDAGMVKVRWVDSVDATALYWEYLAELSFQDPTDEAQGT